LLDRFDNEVERGGWNRYLDWLLALPKEYDLRVWDRVKELTKGKTMPYVTLAERYGKEKGLIEGRKEGRYEAIEVVLDLRFPGSPAKLMPQVRQVEDLDKLHELLDTVKASDLATIQARISAAIPASN